MDAVTAGLLAGLAVLIGTWVSSSRASHEQDLWRQSPAAVRAAYEAVEAAEWLRGAGDPDASARRLEATLETCRTAGDITCEVLVLNGLGRHFHDVGEPGETLRRFEEARSRAAGGPSRSLEGRALNGLGMAYRDLGDPPRALELHQQALQVLEEAGDLRGQALAFDGLGADLRDLGRRKEALKAFGQAVELFGDDWMANQQRGGFHEGGTSVEGAAALVDLGAAYRDAGNPEASQRYYQWALQSFQRLGHRRGAAVTLLNMGAAYRDRGEADLALDYYQQALPLLHGLRHRAGEAQAAVAMARLLGDRASGRSIFHGKQAVAIYEATRDELRSLDPTLQATYTSTVAGTYRSLAGLLAARARIPEAQEVLSLLKQREYFEFIRRDATEAKQGGVPWTSSEARLLARFDELCERFADTQRELVALRRKQFLSMQLRDVPVRLPLGPHLTAGEEARLVELDGQEAQALTAFRTFFAGLEAGVAVSEPGPERLAAPARLAQLLDQLGPGYVGVYTLVGEAEVRMILVTPVSAHAYTSPLPAKALAESVLALREALEDPRQDPRPAARRVHDAIVAPMASDLDAAGAEAIVWSLDGVLRYVPMGALHDGQHWLVERYRSVVMPGGGDATVTSAPRRPWSVVGLGVTRGHEGFAPLPGVREELEAVVRGAHGQGVLPGVTLLDEAFTLQSFAGALERQYPVVHVASHFLFRPGDESRSFLLLGDGSHLTLGEVRVMPSRFQGVDQVTLSACESAVPGGDGAEIDGLAVLVQRKGAAAVLASLWPVADVVTPAQMRAYYSWREAGMSRAQALQAVQLAMIHGELRPSGQPSAAGGWEHPFFWAPFILLGDGR